MKVEVRFFGQLIDKLGLAVYQLEVSAQKFEDVRDDLEQAFPALKSMSYQLAQNNAIIEGETVRKVPYMFFHPFLEDEKE